MQQESLFTGDHADRTEGGTTSFDLPDADVRLYNQWLSGDQADHCLKALRQSLAWEQSVIQIYGRETPIPRLNAWYGDPGCDYSYSGYRLPLHPWTDELTGLRRRLENETGEHFNSVLANCYRDGQDSVSWHADDEPELGTRPVIASLSLGASRRFVLKHKRRKDLAPVSVDLAHGALLIMAGATQHHWVHALPKTRKSVAERINLTFRLIRH